jgi:hypothetical protein
VLACLSSSTACCLVCIEYASSINHEASALQRHIMQLRCSCGVASAAAWGIAALCIKPTCFSAALLLARC